jgi:hypothetical protein
LVFAVVLEVVTRGTMIAAITPKIVTTASSSSSENAALRWFDLNNMERTIKASGHWYRDFISGRVGVRE